MTADRWWDQTFAVSAKTERLKVSDVVEHSRGWKGTVVSIAGIELTIRWKGRPPVGVYDAPSPSTGDVRCRGCGVTYTARWLCILCRRAQE